MSNLPVYVQKASKLQGNVNKVSNLWTLYGHIEYRLVTFWTFVIWGTKDVQTQKKCPKYVHNVSKLWTLLWTHRKHILSNRKVSTFWTFLVKHTKHVQTPRKCPIMSIMCQNFGHFLDTFKNTFKLWTLFGHI